MKSLNTPWHFNQQETNIYDCEGTWIGVMEHHDHSEYVVRAVNCHNELLEACKRFVKLVPGMEIHNWPPAWKMRDEAMTLAKAAIAKAEQLQ